MIFIYIMSLTMSEIKISYPHLENAQQILDCIHKHFNEFDFRGENAERDDNRDALAKVCEELKLWIDICTIITHGDDDEYDVAMAHFNAPIYNEVVLMTHYDWLIFDFASPFDALSLLNEIMWIYYNKRDVLEHKH